MASPGEDVTVDLPQSHSLREVLLGICVGHVPTVVTWLASAYRPAAVRAVTLSSGSG